MARGATLAGTEAPDLLLEEYNLAQQCLLVKDSSGISKQGPHGAERSSQLLDRRDRYIAARINQTLQPGETGLVFLGMLHSLEGRLAPDIQLTRLSPSMQKEPPQL
jgi:hypothetical protein